MKRAIITVTNNAFIEGTLTLFHSFLKHNQWYNGELIVITDDLDNYNRGLLSSLFNAKIQSPSDQLKYQVDRLVNQIESYRSTKTRFYSLEIFNQKFDQILFLDSDMLCIGNVKDLFRRSGNLLACADLAHYGGYLRDRDTFLPVLVQEAQASMVEDQCYKSFNTGLLLLKPKYFGSDYYDFLCNQISFEVYKNIESGHTDSVILNLNLVSSVDWLPIYYNFYYHLWQRFPHFREEDILSDIRFIHFNGKIKPWVVSKEKEDILVDLWHSAFEKIK